MLNFDIFDLFNIYSGHGMSDGEFLFNNCFSPVTQVGDIISGTLAVDVTSDGTLIYNYQASISTGEFIMQFGIAGNEKLENVVLMIVDHEIDHVELQWDEANSYYTGSNLSLANELQLLVGEVSCFNAIVIPELLIHYTFEEIVDD